MVWGGEKAGVAAKGKDVERRSVACEQAGQLHGPYANRPGPARWFFKIIEPGPNRRGQARPFGPCWALMYSC